LQEVACQCADPDENAHQRLTSEEGIFLAAVLNESKKFGQNVHLLEKIVGQLGVVGLKLINANNEIPDSEIRLELLRLAAEVTILAVRGTPEYSFPSSDA
jgi:hypothetical protein